MIRRTDEILERFIRRKTPNNSGLAEVIESDPYAKIAIVQLDGSDEIVRASIAEGVDSLSIIEGDGVKLEKIRGTYYVTDKLVDNLTDNDGYPGRESGSKKKELALMPEQRSFSAMAFYNGEIQILSADDDLGTNQEVIAQSRGFATLPTNIDIRAFIGFRTRTGEDDWSEVEYAESSVPLRGQIAQLPASNKYITGTVLLEGYDGAAWNTITSTEYRVKRKTGRIVQKLDIAEWENYTQFRITYDIFDAVTAVTTNYPQVALTMSRRFQDDATDTGGEVDLDTIKNVTIEEGHIGGFTIEAGKIQSDNNKLKINSRVPSFSMGASVSDASSGFSSGTGIWMGKFAAPDDWRFRVGDPSGQNPLFEFNNVDLKLRSAGIEVWNAGVQMGNVEKTGNAWFGKNSGNTTRAIQWWTTGGQQGDVQIGGDDNHVLWDDDGSAGDARGILYIKGNVEISGELKTTVFTKAQVQATAGTVIIAKNASILTANVTTGSTTTLNIKNQDGAAIASTDASSALQDRLLVKSAAGENWFRVTAISSSSDGSRDYTCTRLSGSNVSFKKGASVVNFGITGQGILYLTADDGDGPFYSVRTHANSPWLGLGVAGGLTEVGRFGNMKNSFGIGANNYYGFGVGDFSGGNYLKYETNGGFLLKGGNNAVGIDSDGLSLTAATSVQSQIKWYSGADTLAEMGMYDVSSPILRIAAIGRGTDGSDLVLQANNQNGLGMGLTEIDLAANYSTPNNSVITFVAAASVIAEMAPNQGLGMKWYLNHTFSPDNTRDVGLKFDGTQLRPRDLYLGRDAYVGGFARISGAVSESAVGSDNVRIGIASNTPRIILENASDNIWEIDSDESGMFRVFLPGDPALYIDGNKNFGLWGTSFGGGEQVIYIENRVTAPTSNPSVGGLLYAESGAGKWRGSSGTVTTFGPAEPHCPICGKDFVLEWENDKFGHLLICMWCATDGLKKGIVKRENVIKSN